MSDELLQQLADRAGIEPDYEDTWGHHHTVSAKTRYALLKAMGFGIDSEDDLQVSLSWLEARQGTATNNPEQRAWRPGALDDNGRAWGIAVQLYGLRSARNWGIGDFTDLRGLMRGAAALGASAIGVNPLHALFPDRPEHASPYSPSSRYFINPLYLDIEAIADYADCTPVREQVASAKFQARLAAAHASERVDYSAVAALKWPVLEKLYTHFVGHHRQRQGDPRAAAFRDFQRELGPGLRRFATFHALAATQSELDWRRWPTALADPGSAAIATFVDEHIQAIEFHEYLQWQAMLQLDNVNAVARETGMRIGLYGDLAVGADPTGAESWATQDQTVLDATIGAPPDALNVNGQDWGMPPSDPATMATGDGASFAGLLAANMHHAGALRIDHIMGLMRLWWIPKGSAASDGAYVRYPWHALLGALVRTSRAQQCLVVGEDLGTVPAGLRESMYEAGILSYRLLYFEQDGGRFRAPHEYPAAALVAAGTHDLPPLAMWWRGEDIALRERLGLWPDDDTRDAAVRDRAAARQALMQALQSEGLADDGMPEQAPVEAVHTYLARTPCKLLMIQFEDMLDQHTQVNVPGTSDEYPNWRQRMPCDIDAALADPRMRKVASLLNAEGRGTFAEDGRT